MIVNWTLARNRLDACNACRYLEIEKDTPGVVAGRTGKQRLTNLFLFSGDGVHA